MFALLACHTALVPHVISLPSSLPLAAAPARATLAPSRHAVSHSAEIVSNLGIFPVKPPLPEPTSLLATEEKTLTEEEMEKRDAARRVAWIVFVAGGAPSLFAQYSLVWSKEPKKRQAEAEAEAARLASKRGPAGRGALPKEVQAVVDQRFRATYAQKDLDALWRVLRTAYGSEGKALLAVKQNPTILNPACMPRRARTPD